MANPKPVTEQKLFDLQARYLLAKGEEKKNLSQEFFPLLLRYAQSLLLQSLKSFSIHLSPQDIYDRTVDIVLEIFSELEQGKQVYLSFAGLIKLKILKVLFSTKLKRLEKISSLNKEIEFNSNSKELINIFSFKETAFGTPTEINDLLEEIDTSHEYVRSIIKVLQAMFEPDVNFSLRNKLILIVGVFHCFFNKKHLDIYKERFMNSDKFLLEAFDIILKEIYNILQNKEDYEREEEKEEPKKQLLNFKKYQEDNDY